MPNPYVFIVGCPRSGTTLLQRIVDAHPQIAITPETHWIPKFFKDGTGLTPDGSLTPSLVAALLNYRTLPSREMGREQLDQLFAHDEPVSYAGFISGIFDLYGQARGKTRVGDKTPGYCRDLPL